MADDRSKTARAILFGIVASLCVLVLAIGFSLALFVFRHRDSRILTAEAAAFVLDGERARFAAQSPLIEIHDGGEPVHAVDRAPLAPAARTLHVTVFESRSGRLLHVILPLSVVRLVHSDGFTWLGQMTFLEDTEFDPDRVLLTLDDLSRGPRLLVDHRHRGGAQFLAWVD